MILNKATVLTALKNYYDKYKDKDIWFRSKFTKYCFENILDHNALDIHFIVDRAKFLAGTCLIEDILDQGRSDIVNFYYVDTGKYYDYTFYVFYQDEDNILVLNEINLKDFDFNILIDKTDFKAYLSFNIMLDKDKNIIGKVL